jgi:DNA-binding transcriptional MocR family regulator
VLTLASTGYRPLYQYGWAMSGDATSITGRNARDIADSIERAVDAGLLESADPLPSVRTLAARLGVSPATVAAAYRDLRTRGLVTSEAGRATRIGTRRPVRSQLTTPPDADVRDLSSGNPDPALLPSLRDVLARRELPRYLYGTPAVLPELETIAREQFHDLPGSGACAVGVVGGAIDGVERVLAACARPNDRVLVEDPGYSEILDLVASLGMVAVPVAVDQHGPVPDSLAEALAQRPAAFVVTPRAQNPTGATLLPARGEQLREILGAHPDVLVIEDDHASVISLKPYVSLCGGRRSWAVVRSTSKHLGPDLRVGFLATDERTARRMADRQAPGVGGVSHLIQHLVVELWRDATVWAGVREAAARYHERRQTFLERLAANGVVGHGGSGLNVMVPVPREVPVVQQLYRCGWAVRAGEAHRMRSAPFIRVTSASLHAEESERLAADISAAVAPRSVRRLA